MENTEKNFNNEHEKPGFHEGYLHVNPKEGKITGVVKETSEGLVYVKRDGTEVKAERQDPPEGMVLDDGHMYIKTENTPENLRGFVAMAEEMYKQAHVEQFNLNKVKESLDLPKEFILHIKISLAVEEVEEKIVEQMGEEMSKEDDYRVSPDEMQKRVEQIGEEITKEEKEENIIISVLERIASSRKLEGEKQQTKDIWDDMPESSMVLGSEEIN